MKPYTRLKFACYTANITMSVVSNLPPLLFLTFRSLYGLSYSVMGLLILINFCTQLTVDLIFSFFSHRFSIPRAVKLAPVIAVTGLSFYALMPCFFPDLAVLWLVTGTVIFSAASGLCEVLISPVIAAIPAENPEREMSKLHSIYAWGVVGVVIVSTLYLLFLGGERWHWLAVGFLAIPLSSAVLFARVEIPPMETPQRVTGALKLLRNRGVWLCVFAIFLGGAAECTMAQWSSGYLERAIGIPKVIGDMLGVALFAFMLGLGRSLYAKYGKNLTRLLFLSAIGATVCYLIAVLTTISMIALVACAMTGLCTAMLWPGSLVVASDRYPAGGVFIFAMMAAGGDMGAALVPQLVGSVTDAVIANPDALALAAKMGLTGDQLGMKLGMLVGMLFPLMAIAVFAVLHKKRNSEHS